MSMYLKLFHGRVAGAEGATRYDGQPIDDWGHCGPTFGPLTYVHTTYGVHINIEYTKEDADRTLNITNSDVVFFDGHEYGDWSVYEANEPDLGCGSNPFFQRCAGSDVCVPSLDVSRVRGANEGFSRTNVLISTGEAFDAAQHDHPAYVAPEPTETIFDKFQRAAEAALSGDHGCDLHTAWDMLDRELAKPEHAAVAAWYQHINDVAGNDPDTVRLMSVANRKLLTEIHSDVNLWFANAAEGESGSLTAYRVRSALRGVPRWA